MEQSVSRTAGHEGSMTKDPRRKHILLLAENTLWRTVEEIEKAFLERIDITTKPGANRAQHRVLSTREEVLGISTETLRKMANGNLAKGNRVTSTVACNLMRFAERAEYKQAFLAERHPERITKRTREAVASLKDIASKIQEDNIQQSRGEGIDNYEFGRILGMSRADVQKAIAGSIHNAKPLLKIFYLEGEDPNSEFGLVEGVYYLWMLRSHSMGDMTSRQLWMRCGLHVRHVVDVHSQSVIVAKLNIPALKSDRVQEGNGNSGQSHHQYDGVISIRDKRYFWSFEKRVPVQEDLIHIISEPGKNRKRVAFAGYYLTVDQDPDQTITTGAAIIRMPLSKPDVEKFMQTAPQVFERGAKEFDDINAISMAAGKTYHTPPEADGVPS